MFPVTYLQNLVKFTDIGFVWVVVEGGCGCKVIFESNPTIVEVSLGLLTIINKVGVSSVYFSLVE